VGGHFGLAIFWPAKVVKERVKVGAVDFVAFELHEPRTGVQESRQKRRQRVPIVPEMSVVL
jgi:hypothetical protein